MVPKSSSISSPTAIRLVSGVPDLGYLQPQPLIQILEQVLSRNATSDFQVPEELDETGAGVFVGALIKLPDLRVEQDLFCSEMLTATFGASWSVPMARKNKRRR